ncbi:MULTISPECIES: Fic family protein [Anaerococcus]|uniref:Fic family protein n=1 Tax=Anaerococcus TaxID=165779 RepID=UPI001E474C48|nr:MULTISPECIES: Fic family protein [Anaerococcus]MDY3006636.1 Fic family protein [Anaerococcus porci]
MNKFHIEYEAIHPFIDGNVRTGRFLVNLELIKTGYPPIDIKFTNRVSYYKDFNEHHTKGDLSDMENLFAGYLIERPKYYINILSDE